MRLIYIKQTSWMMQILLYKEVAKSSDNPEVFVNLAIAQSQQKNYNEALATLKSAEAKFPNNSQLSDALKNIKAEAVGVQFDKAAEYFNNKDYQSSNQ